MTVKQRTRPKTHPYTTLHASIHAHSSTPRLLLLLWSNLLITFCGALVAVGDEPALLVMSRCQEIHDVEPFKTVQLKPWGNAANTDFIIWPWYTKGRSVLWCWTPFSASNPAGKDNSDFGKALWRWALYPASNTAEKYCQESGK